MIAFEKQKIFGTVKGGSCAANSMDAHGRATNEGPCHRLFLKRVSVIHPLTNNLSQLRMHRYYDRSLSSPNAQAYGVWVQATLTSAPLFPADAKKAFHLKGDVTTKIMQFIDILLGKTVRPDAHIYA